MFLPRIVRTKGTIRARLEQQTSGKMSRVRNRCLIAAATVAVWWLVFVYRFVSDGEAPAESTTAAAADDDLTRNYHIIPEKFISRDALSKAVEADDDDDICAGRYVYIQDLPWEYHAGLLESCVGVPIWRDMCRDIKNNGFGIPMAESEGVFPEKGWWGTTQFSLEIVYHHKVLHYRCRTEDPAQSAAIFVPFYSGLEVMPHLWDGANITHRDEVPKRFAELVTSKPEWARLDGHDHFMVAGRVTWDFRRTTDKQEDWGNTLLLLPPLKNMTTVTIEASPYHSNDFGIPYPTYFHPTTDAEVFAWQDRVAHLTRPSLFCFAGARRPKQDLSIRDEIIDQCRDSAHCHLLACGEYAGKCHEPANVIRLFQGSDFCLQPSGDSYTRKSLFDGILSGCIPVVFHPYSAYTQYRLYFPSDPSSYSVFIDEEFLRAKNVSIERVLLGYSRERIEAMRRVVISLIPRIVYSDPMDNSMTLKDAFDISIDGVLDRIRDYKATLRREQAPSAADPSKKRVLDGGKTRRLSLRSGRTF